MDINGLCKHHREAEMKPSHSIHTYIHIYALCFIQQAHSIQTPYTTCNQHSLYQEVSVFQRQDIHVVARVVKSQVGGQAGVCMYVYRMACM